MPICKAKEGCNKHFGGVCAKMCGKPDTEFVKLKNAATPKQTFKFQAPVKPRNLTARIRTRRDYMPV